MVQWDPGLYARFGDHRERPFYELISRVRAEDPGSVVDLGCGPGNLTAVLARRWPQATVVGVDSSAEMLAKAEQHRDSFPNLAFRQRDIAAWSPDPGTDVVVTNAALQWVPQHRKLIPEWLRALRPGAWFAMQVPGNFEAPSHTLMRELAASPRWGRLLDNVLRHDDAVGQPAEYLEIMLDADCDADAWETTYLQVLEGDDAVLEWVRGTALRPVLAALTERDAAAFEDEYAELLREAYPQGDYGTVFPFRRIFAVAHKRG